MDSSTLKESQHPFTTQPSTKKYNPPLATKTYSSSASTQRSQWEPGFKSQTGTRGQQNGEQTPPGNPLRVFLTVYFRNEPSNTSADVVFDPCRDAAK